MREVKPQPTEEHGTRLDRAIFALFPRWGAKRINMRVMQQVADRRYSQLSSQWDGATKDRKHGDKWLGSRLSPDSALEQDLLDMRQRSEQLYQEYSFCRGAIDTRVDNVVGKGFRYQSQIRAVDGLITEQQAEQFNREIEAVVQRWQVQAGRAGRSFGQLQRIAARSVYRAGDILRVFSDVGRTDKPVPLQVNLIDAARIATPPSESANPRCRMGVKYDANGDILGYYTRKSDPDDALDYRQEEYEFWPIDRAQLIYEPLWEQQSRGVPWFSSVLSDCKDWKDFKESVIIAAQVAACQTLVIGTSNPAAMASSAMGAATNGDGDREEAMRPGRILYRNDTDVVEGFNPTQPATTFGMFGDYNLMSQAAGLNWPVTWLTKDYSRVNFISGRLGEIDGRMVIRSDQQLLSDTLLNPTADRVVTEAVIVGAVSIDPTLFDQNRNLFLRHNWIGPGRPWVDPREVQANIAAKEHNLDTLANIHSRLGLDTDEVFDARSRERQREEQLDIMPPLTSGQPQQDDTAVEPSSQKEEVAV